MIGLNKNALNRMALWPITANVFGRKFLFQKGLWKCEHYPVLNREL